MSKRAGGVSRMQKYLLDSNVLLRFILPSHSEHDTARRAVAQLMRQGFPLYLAPQCLFEFWVVATRPIADNGFGLTPRRAAADITALQGL